MRNNYSELELEFVVKLILAIMEEDKVIAEKIAKNGCRKKPTNNVTNIDISVDYTLTGFINDFYIQINDIYFKNKNTHEVLNFNEVYDEWICLNGTADL